MLLANEPDTRGEGLLTRRPPNNWVKFFHTSVCIVVTVLFVLSLFDCLGRYGACRIVNGPCDEKNCCAIGFSCIAKNGSSVCLPDCPTALWEACDDGKCCPEKSVCTPRTTTFSQCVPALPRTALMAPFRN